MHALHPCFLQEPRFWNVVLPPDLTTFSNSLSGNGQVSLHDVGILSKSHMHTGGSAVPQPCRLSAGVKFDSIALSDICTVPSECHTGFCNSGSDLIINVHCSEESASQVGEFINNFRFLSTYSNC